MKRNFLFIPLIIFLAMAAAFLVQLMRNADGDDPTRLESALIGKFCVQRVAKSTNILSNWHNKAYALWG